jgi:hypothetical protein
VIERTKQRRDCCGLVRKAICRHCKQGSVTRLRGLCWTCYYADGVRDLYPSTSKFARTCTMGRATAPLPAAPTTAAPGTPEKMAVLESRAIRGERIFHPLDRQQDESLEEHRMRIVGAGHRLRSVEWLATGTVSQKGAVPV